MFFERSCFSLLRWRLAWVLLRRDQNGTLVLWRVAGISRARVSSSVSRFTASARFAFWVRNCWALTRIIPSLEALFCIRARMRCFCDSVRVWHSAMSKRRVTLVFSLFTFCPPGPELREQTKVKYSSLMTIPLGRLIIGVSFCRVGVALIERAFISHRGRSLVRR